LVDIGVKDAVHVPVVAIVAQEDLQPGQPYPTDKPVGIVDPYRKGTIKAGGRFWLCLYPGSIRSLRHNWTHPEFDVENCSEEATASAETRLRDFADNISIGYSELIDFLEADGYAGDNQGLGEIPDSVWIDYEAITGRKGGWAPYFTCGC
jgi:hypothetical protein